jgi:ketosteroid isomerase-like protein
MSQENVEIVREVLAEFRETQQPVERLLAPDFVWDLRSWPVWTGQAEFHGADGFREFFVEWTDAYEEWTHEVESFIDVDESRVVVTTVQRGRLRGSDSWVDLRAAFLYTVAEGLIRRIEVYESPAQALKAAGLSE